MLEVESLNRSSNKVITSDSFLAVVSIVFVPLFSLLTFLRVASRRHVESEQSFCLFEIDFNVRFKILNS